MTYDLIIVGGGPAGCAAAITAARLGAKVLLIERGHFPRHKVCGEFVSAESLAKVHAPLGFDIGSQTVPEIAVSIVAELIACRNRGATISAARINVKV